MFFNKKQVRDTVATCACEVHRANVEHQMTGPALDTVRQGNLVGGAVMYLIGKGIGHLHEKQCRKALNLDKQDTSTDG